MISVVKSPSVTEIIKKLESSDSGQSYDVLNKTGEKKKITENKAVQRKEQKEFSGDIDPIWAAFIKDLGEKKNPLHYILRPVIPHFDSGILTLNYPYGIDIAEYAKTLDRKVLDFIEKDLSQRCGENIKCFFDQLKRPETGSVKESGKSPAVEEYSPEEAPLPEAEMISQPEKGDFEVENPSIARIKNAFYGEIIKKGE
jgi:hypothetical protein